jgi:hypothetical protein
MKKKWPALIFATIATTGFAQPPVSREDPVLDQENAIAAQVEAHTHIDGFDLKAKLPAIRIDAGPELSKYDGTKQNVVHEEIWKNVPAPERATFDQWASYTTDEPSGQALFRDMFYRFFLVHEMGHWMQDQVMDQRRDKEAARAEKNADTNRWQYETVANRISVAWWREHDPSYLTKLVNDFRTIQAKLPNPVPAGEDPRHFFTRQYTKLAEDPNAYGWFQLQMVLLAYDERPTSSFQQAISKLPAENYDK